MDGPTLSGIGALCTGVAALLAFIWAVVKGPAFFDGLRDKSQLAKERDEWKRIAEREREDRVAAEQRANNWERGAAGAQFDLDGMEQRLLALEKRDREREATFVEVVAYARDVLQWAVKADQIARLGGLQLMPVPPIPESLYDILKMPRSTVVES